MHEGKKGAVYICHTYYHVYISMLKEFAKPKSEQGNASIMLSTLSTDFENLEERLNALNYFKEVIRFEEKRFDEFPEVDKYHHPSNFFIASLWNRIIFTKKYGKAVGKNVPVNLREYKDIYVFCDSDPIGYYLNYKHIYYHAVEDGLDTIKTHDSARGDNENNFELKAFLSRKMNWIFIQNGFGKYCIDMEVNDMSVLKYPCPCYVEVSRKALMDRLNADNKDMLLKAFVKNSEKIKALCENKTKAVLILTEPLCDLETRKRIFKDLSHKYEGEYEIIIKQHPRDLLNYEEEFSEYVLIDRTVPMEMLNLFDGFRVDIVISVFTELGCIQFANEKIRLGRDFMDAYEERSKHEAHFESVRG